MWLFIKIQNFTVLVLHLILTFSSLLSPIIAFRHSEESTKIRNGTDHSLRIVGGESIKISQFPFQASVEFYGMHFCGGAILTRMHVITAAHCGIDRTTKELKVRVGSTLKERKGYRRSLAQIILHPKFNRTLLLNDLAILKLVNPIPFTSKTQPILLPPSGIFWPIGSKGIVTGWGFQYENQNPADVLIQLQAAEVEIMDLELCVKKFPTMVIQDTMICVGSPSWTKDSCQGDSGGPFFVDGLLAGIISYGTGCARPNIPAVYTKVSSFIPFIEKVLQF